MAEAAVTILLGNMSELEIYHADLISGAEKELQQLKNDLAVLKAFLQDEAADTPALREMKTQIKEVVYEVEDTIESRLSQATTTTTATKISKKLFNSRDVSLAKEVKLLREGKVKELLHKVRNYSSRSIASDATSRRRRIPPTAAPAMTKDKVVGLEDEVNTIIEYLIEPKAKLDVISIIGMVGLGMTTLARKVFESERIASEFRTRIWVHFSRRSQVRDVWLSILNNFTSQDMSSLDEEELVKTIGALLKEKKFLLVVDDVCSSDQWKAAMQPILPRSNGMGKVLITSREKHVTDGKTYELRCFLRPEESWKLLQLQVFGNLGGCPKELEEVGKSIAAQCKLPLEIVVLGRVLSDQLKEREWRKVLENGDLFLNNEEGMLNLVELSYTGLPDELRECFLYMGVFPEDFEISVWTLTRLWIAEGFVQPMEGKSLEEIAAENLDLLISRNLVIADKMKNFNGEVKTCRLHDMIHKFCITKSEKQNLFHEIKDSGVVEQNPHRLFSHHHPSNFLSGNLINGLKTRSFLCFYDQPVELKLEHIPNSFPRLRLLESSNSIKFRDFPAKLTKLIHLRYLTLYIDALKTLPESLSRLWNLQTLTVETKSASIETKANIWKMIQLRHLKTDAAISLSSKGEGHVTLAAGEKLQTLDKLSPESCTEDLFKRACNLKRLGVRGKLDTHSGHMFLEKLTSLEKLKLENDLRDEIASNNMLAGVLKPKCLPPYLKRLTLSNTFLEWKHISTLATIESLEVLKLKCNAFIGTHWSVSDDCFPNLQFLLIAGANLAQWEASDNCFLSLKCLMLKDCEKLIEIPKTLARTLQVLDIMYVSKSAVESARKIEEEEKKQPFKLSIGRGC